MPRRAALYELTALRTGVSHPSSREKREVSQGNPVSLQLRTTRECPSFTVACQAWPPETRLSFAEQMKVLFARFSRSPTVDEYD